MTREAWIESVAAGTPGPEPLADVELVDAMVAAGMEAIRRDLLASRRLGAKALKLAKKLRDDRSVGLSERLLGHVHLLKGHSAKAIPHYVRARERFSAFPADHAATATAMLQALAYVGDFEHAFEVAEQAHAFFLSEGDEVRAARIEANKANALHRLDRLTEAKASYVQALRVLREKGTAADVAIVMRNFAVTLMGLLELDAADAMYLETRQRFEEENQSALVLEVDLNRAYLLGRRGLMREALRSYRHLRAAIADDLAELSFEAGHSLLDQADLMLEVGLWSDAIAAAGQASEVFQTLGLRFEQGKARLLQAQAEARSGASADATAHLRQAARLLKKVPNPVWQALVKQTSADLLRASLSEGQATALFREAEALLSESTGRERRAAIERELTGLLLNQGELEEAATRLARTTMDQAADLALKARLARAQGKPDAKPLMRKALERWDDDRAAMGPSLLRQAAARAHEAFLRSALDLFETPEDRFDVVRRLKHQSLAELVEAPEAVAADDATRRIREALFALQSVSREEAADRAEARAALEAELTQRLREAQMDADHEAATLDRRPDVPEGVRLVEMFAHEGRLRAILLDPGSMREADLGPVEGFQREMRLFRMNVSRAFRSPGVETNRQLDALGAMLGPIWDAPSATTKWIIGREPSLAALPFHAVRIDGQYAYERGEVAFSPTVSAWAALNQRPYDAGHGVAVVGFADDLAPQIGEEAAAVASLWGVAPRSLNETLTPEALAGLIEGAELVHLAAHGIQREDRPLLSSLKLGGGEWSVFDLSQLRLKANLVTLSGCSTGHAAVGDALDAQGFIEALLVAGARNVLASLWDVDDASTRNWMERFYAGLRDGASLFEAHRMACDGIRADSPNPAFWAPFALFGGTLEKPVRMLQTSTQRNQ